MRIAKASKSSLATASCVAPDDVVLHDRNDNRAAEIQLKPPLKWAGGKRWLVSLAVFLAIPESRFAATVEALAPVVYSIF